MPDGKTWTVWTVVGGIVTALGLLGAGAGIGAAFQGYRNEIGLLNERLSSVDKLDAQQKDFAKERAEFSNKNAAHEKVIAEKDIVLGRLENEKTLLAKECELAHKADEAVLAQTRTECALQLEHVQNELA